MTHLLESSAEISGDLVISLLAVSFVFQTVCKNEASVYLFRMIQAMVIIVHLPMLKIVFPANALILYKILFPLIQFDIFHDEIVKFFIKMSENLESVLPEHIK